MEPAGSPPGASSLVSSSGSFGHVSTSLPRSHDSAFKALKILDLRGPDATSAAVPLDPSLIHGYLDNGLAYYIKRNAKPKNRVALALAVNVGSVVEGEEERGVAHIVEHLAFSATKKYSNHDIIKFLESIGAEFGACQNAYTSSDETVFELVVPVDKPGLLSTAISVLAEFASEIRASDEDINKERGAVLEEWRERRNAKGRMMEAHWKLLLQGCKYADRLPIGTEQVIRTVNSETIRKFYETWYKPNNMAVVAVGDFEQSEDEVLGIIKEHFGKIGGNSTEKDSVTGSCGVKEFDNSGEEAEGGSSTVVPRMVVPPQPFVSHSEPRLSHMVEKEGEGSAVIVSCKLPVEMMGSVEEYRAFLVEQMFHQALSQRLFHVSRQPQAPFYAASSNSEPVTRSTRAFSLSATCRMRGTLEALEGVWREVKRVQVHGFSEREIARVRVQYLSEMESAFLERDQSYSDSLRAEYVEHFLKGEPVPGIEYEARLAKTLLPGITAAEVSALSKTYSLEQNCIVKILEPKSSTTVDAMRSVIARVEAEAREDGGIAAWEEEALPEKIISGDDPTPGAVEKETEYSELGAVEVLLTNGMRVTYKTTDFLDDQVLISGYAYGGLSEVSEKDYYACALGQAIAEEVGVFGHKPAILMEMLAGKRVELSMKTGTYMRIFSGESSPQDLETAFQLIFQLFTTKPVASDSDMKLILHMTREAIQGQLRDPVTAFSTRVNELNYGRSRFFKPITPSNLANIDPERACAYFDECFKDPSNFTVAIVGKFEAKFLRDLVVKYLGGIPKSKIPFKFSMGFKREELTQLPIEFPKKTVREEVERRMLEEQSMTQITFPVVVPPGAQGVEEVAKLGFLCRFMETRILRTLRFKHGHVYSVSVSPAFNHSRPTRNEEFRGDVAISFCSDPDTTKQLTEMALAEVSAIQESGLDDADVASVLEIEQRGYEMGQHENVFWLDQVLRGYQSRLYDGDLQKSHAAQEAVRLKVRSELNRQTVESAMRQLLPHPCTSLYTAVSLVPLAPFWRRILSLPPKRSPGLTIESKIALGVAGLAMAAAFLWKSASRSDATK